LVEGVAFKKLFTYAGFEQQPKKFLKPKIILLDIELELKAVKDNAELRVQGHEVKFILFLFLFYLRYLQI
jgi:T-complex protein 1 subunit eta